MCLMPPPVLRTEAARALARAKQQIETLGWCQGNGRIGERTCAIIAIADASGELPSFSVMELFAEANDLAYWGIESWNDAPGRTKEEVLAGFDKAIALAEAAA